MLRIQLKLNPNFYLRDPQETKLGKNIVTQSIQLIDELGLEQFTFKKLAHAINSTEASIYRYFDNKHRLLTYLVAWYWNWLEYQIDYQTHFLENPEQKLKKAIGLITHQIPHERHVEDVDEKTLYRLVINESDKTYRTKQVDADNKEGLFRGYKSLCTTIASILLEINPDFPYAHSLTSTVLETAHQQVFFAEHLPTLSSFKKEDTLQTQKLTDFLELLVFCSIQNKTSL